MKALQKNKQKSKGIFQEQVKRWSDNASNAEFPDWEEQIRLLSEIGDLITPDLRLEELISVIYASVNQLMDAYQFAVGLYDEAEGVILFKGMIENNQQFPDLVIDVHEDNRLTAWCVQHASEIFINDIETEYTKYVNKIPHPKVGSAPNAALYVPIHMHDKVVGLITVRTPHKNVYQRHHLYILKTLGNFMIRTLALAEERAKPFVRSETGKRNWHWGAPEQLSLKSKRLLSLLTDREREVLFLLVSGKSNKSIAEQLFVSPGTIKTHTLNIYQKMEVNNRTSAIMKAIELNWVV
jgi:DNA-binding CsgD family transcriptional regulator